MRTKRILCLNIRESRFAYGVLEGHNTLLDWGIRTFDRRSKQYPQVVMNVTESLLRAYKPSHVVYSRARYARAPCRIESLIARFLKGKRVPFREIPYRKIREMFSQLNKHALAKMICVQYPELASLLPDHPRKLWEPERHSLAIFDAIATGLASLQSHRQQPE